MRALATKQNLQAVEILLLMLLIIPSFSFVLKQTFIINVNFTESAR